MGLDDLQQQMGLRFANRELVEVCATTIASLSGFFEVGLGSLMSARLPGTSPSSQQILSRRNKGSYLEQHRSTTEVQI